MERGEQIKKYIADGGRDNSGADDGGEKERAGLLGACDQGRAWKDLSACYEEGEKSEMKTEEEINGWHKGADRMREDE